MYGVYQSIAIWRGFVHSMTLVQTVRSANNKIRDIANKAKDFERCNK